MNGKYLLLLATIVVAFVLFGGCTQSERQFKNAKPDYERALSLIAEKNLTEAETFVDKAVDEYPEYIEAHILRQYLRSKHVPEDVILKDYEKLSHDNRKSAVFHFLYARLLPDPEQQKTEYEKAIDLAPNLGWGHFGLGWIEYKKKRFAQAKDYFDKAIKLDPENPLFLCDMGGVCFYLGEYDQSLTYLNKARELDPTFARPYASLATVYYQRGDLDMAVQMLEHFISLSSAAPDYAVMSSKLLQLRGK